MLRGATQQILDEAERSLHDALCVLAQTVKEPRTVYGGGCSEMLMAKVVTDLANRTPGKEAVAMESFAKALRMVGGPFYLFLYFLLRMARHLNDAGLLLRSFPPSSPTTPATTAPTWWPS